MFYWSETYDVLAEHENASKEVLSEIKKIESFDI